ncbi:hypothetical protein FNW25_03440 [Flavobacterium franklandianum]|uniref:hypothetical protein n=1 Tax=Flavobacterium franklandianum TaxID=2594430 RepID=UPI00117998D7|nr:hypothetical protein [Flavobacterium franklandianum]TRX29167.1 hypothetical protein FNW25_03440 [Flavobacterium franklandianum]
MKKGIALFFFFLGFLVQAQENSIIQQQEIVRIETELASDKMEGRAIFTPGIDSASVFIENEFKKINLTYFKGLNNYRQEFVVKRKPANNVIGILPGKSK